MTRAALAVVLVILGGWWVTTTASDGASPSPPAATLARGRSLYLQACSSCHGFAARGLPGKGPSLREAGAQAADFYLRTGRMPLDNPTDEPLRTKPAYGEQDIRALVAFVGSLGGPAIPRVDPARGDVAAGRKAFTEHCAGCHQVVARGGIVTGAAAPALDAATPLQVAEAIRVGPYLMPVFGPGEIDAQQVDDIARYVRYTRHPQDAGGWGIGHLGPIPEGMIAWLLAGAVLLGVARLIGERAR